MKAYVHNFSIWCKLFSSSKQKNHSWCKTPENWHFIIFSAVFVFVDSPAFYLIRFKKLFIFSIFFVLFAFECLSTKTTKKQTQLTFFIQIHGNVFQVNAMLSYLSNGIKNRECFEFWYAKWVSSNLTFYSPLDGNELMIVFRALLYRKKNKETYYLDLSIRLDDIFILSFLNLLSHSHFCTVCFAICFIQFFFFLFFSFNESVLTWSFYRFHPFCKKPYFHTIFFVIFQHYST